MAIDYSILAQPKRLPRALTRGWKKKANEDRLEAAYAIVDARDAGNSRISGKPTLTGTSDQKLLRDHCHLQGKGAHPEHKYDPNNIFLATRLEHKLYDAHAIEVEGTDCSKRLIFRWNRRLVEVGKEPFKLLSKRRSQNK